MHIINAVVPGEPVLLGQGEPFLAQGEPPVLISREVAAVMLSLSVRSIDYLVSQGKLPARKLGRRKLIPRAAIVQLVSGGDIPRITQQQKEGTQNG